MKVKVGGAVLTEEKVMVMKEGDGEWREVTGRDGEGGEEKMLIGG